MSSAAEARSRDGAAQLRGCRLRYQPGVPTRVGAAALGTAKRRAEQPRVEPVLRGCTTASAMFLKDPAVARAATRADALMHHAVIRQRHARCAEPKAVMHLLPAISRGRVRTQAGARYQGALRLEFCFRLRRPTVAHTGRYSMRRASYAVAGPISHNKALMRRPTSSPSSFWQCQGCSSRA